MTEKQRDLTAVLPYGNDFVFWETEQAYTRELHVSAAHGSDDTGDGSPGAPFATINAAAAIAAAGTQS